jgi:hypothetical protein
VNTPLLLIAWRRPHTLRKVIDAIRPVAPTRLFVACDGPSPERSGEGEKVAATRRVIEEEIDWPCQIERLYSDVNQGCRLGVSRAITWFFEQVSEGIILEDDCVPHPDFFPYCTTLLARYRHDSRVWCISGSNFQNGHWRGDSSYYFSRYNHCWGWASWRRCWEVFASEDGGLRQWPALRDSGLLATIFEEPLERNYWSEIWQRLLETDKPDSWAYRWTFVCLANGGLTTSPNVNLVSNVGFGDDAAHTTTIAEPTVANQGLGDLRHPQFVLRDAEADRFTFKYHFGGAQMRRSRHLLLRVKALIRQHFQQLLPATR